MDCLRAPAPFLVAPGRPTTPWSQWLGEFRIFAVASGWDEWTVQRREALLLHCVGQEARRLYFAAAKPAQGVAPGAQEAAIPAQEEDGVKEEGQPTAAVDPVAAISAVFQRLFPETRATHSERMLFRRCYQLDRSPAVYLTELQDLSSRCAFGDLQEQLICEQFIEGCRDDRLRGRLCREPALTVLRILEVAEELEVAAERQRLVGGGGATRAPTSPPAQLEIAAVTAAPRKGVSPCCNCGGPHRTADPCCPARWRRCHNCQQKGHYARFCKEPPKKTKQTKRKPVRTVEVLAVTDDDRKNLWTELRVDQQPLRMLADTGSAVSILPLSVYRKQFRHLPLLPTAVRLEAYGGSSLLVQGVVQVTVQAENGNSSQVSLYVVDAGVPLLGRDLQEKLKLSVIHGATVCAIKEEQMLEELPSLTGFVHRVRLKTEVNPVQQRLRPLPYAVREEVRDHLLKLQQAGVIEPVDASPWISPIVVSRRRNGKLRLCVDLREVNKAVEASGHPLPDMQDMLEQLQGATIFSSLDMKSAYHQLDLHPDSRSLTTFITHQGLMRYRRCPYGLKSLPQAFQKVMEAILRGLEGVQVYLDDVIIYAATSNQHERRLTAVLKRLREHQITLNIEKCKLRREQVEFLGFIISKQGVAVNPDRIKALRELRAPASLKDLQAMLGLFGFYSRFVPAYSTLVEPLRCLLRKGAPPFQWTGELQAVMDDVRQRILGSRALAMYDPTLPTRVTTDASDVGLGAVLSQAHPDGERVTLMTSPGVGRAGLRVARWASRLMAYDFTVEHVRGGDNPADGLSRLPGAEEGELDDDVVAVAAVTAQLGAVQRDELLEATQTDPVLCQLVQQIPRRWPRRRRDCPAELQPFYNCREELSLVGDLVVRGQRVIVPAALRTRMVSLAHEGHQGIVRSKQRARDIYWWPKMDTDIEEAVRNCDVCADVDKSARTRSAPLHPVPLPGAAWEKVGVDFIGPMEARRQHQYAVVLVDYFSKWIEVGFCTEPSTEAVVQFLETLASREGYPKELVSDNGTHFTSAAFADYLRSVGTRHIRVTPYHPAGSGAVERANRTVKSALQAADRSGEDRACYLQKFLQTYRSTPHATTGLSPTELLHGRKLRTRLHAAALPTEEPQDRELRDRVQKRQKKQKRYADERRAAETPRFQVGDWVRCRLVPRPKKGRPRYSEPRRVESRLGPVSYRLDDGSRIHAERLTTARAPQQSQAELHVDQSGQPGAGQRSAVSPTSVPRRGERLEADDWRHAEDDVPLEDGQAVSLGVGRRHTEASRGPAEDGVAVSPEDAEDAREREASPPATERQAEQQDAGVLLSPREAASGAGLVAVEPALQPGARVNSGTQPVVGVALRASDVSVGRPAGQSVGDGGHGW
ncbi:uncharacterized protein K02A2.6-like [Amphibalanus amphitrite]|uniref:uncharacterized protein K02A2.6-like n=1 Tax=Amphibalanus amphitrite TaxID=1232801 RepID=UPI001C8FD456|nr:uncharacterized protein K02A2.6-like [Amphibalanus amphitrite]